MRADRYRKTLIIELVGEDTDDYVCSDYSSEGSWLVLWADFWYGDRRNRKIRQAFPVADVVSVSEAFTDEEEEAWN